MVGAPLTTRNSWPRDSGTDLVVDTNVILAAADRADPSHVACRRLLESHRGPLVTTAMVVAEAGWLIDRQLGARAEAAFYRSIASGDLGVADFGPDDWRRAAELVETYADLHLGGVDAGLIALAERLEVGELATLDRRHFSVVVPAHVAAFKLLP
jgi:predicted nucleic acid-binding protein